MSASTMRASALSRELLLPAIADAFRKLSPRSQFRNPVMFVVFVCSIATTALWIQALGGHGEAPAGFILGVSIWLWFTLLFANFAEAIAEGRGKAQAKALRGARKEVHALKLATPHPDANFQHTVASELRAGDFVLVRADNVIPGDGEVVQGAATVDESAITGESAPVVRESGGDRNSVTGGTRVLSDWIVVRVSANPGESFLDRMIAMVEGAARRKTPNEIALT
ncbi:MAG: potassium-transporting ATPase subunit B, partial [Dokdonella sp.]